MKRWYLFPLSIVYHLLTGVRNVLYDLGILKSTGFQIPIINVGNLSVGGSGKSPMVMYLADLLSEKFRTGVLSRGYGRRTSGFVLVNYNSTYKMIGDEAMQLFERFKNKFVIAVSENRVLGAKKLINDMEIQTLILDDAYQHRAIKPGLNILMTEYEDPFFQDFILPAGDLRESRANANRANIIIVSKCPDQLSEEKKHQFISKLKLKNHQKVYFSKIIYDENVICPFLRQEIPDNNLAYYDILLVTGIANPKPLIEHLYKFSKKVKHLEFKDHHDYSNQDINKILIEFKKMGEYKIILTTEKDFVRLKEYQHLHEYLYYWPINIYIDKSEEFNKQIFQFVKSKI